MLDALMDPLLIINPIVYEIQLNKGGCEQQRLHTDEKCCKIAASIVELFEI